jgi:hypothetical protein
LCQFELTKVVNIYNHGSGSACIRINLRCWIPDPHIQCGSATLLLTQNVVTKLSEMSVREPEKKLIPDLEAMVKKAPNLLYYLYFVNRDPELFCLRSDLLISKFCLYSFVFYTVYVFLLFTVLTACYRYLYTCGFIPMGSLWRLGSLSGIRCF